MYFQGKLTVDPSQLTKIERVKPRKAFKRILHYLTLGNLTEEQEVETFTAISILNQLFVVFVNSNIHNIVRLSHDDRDFYLDEKGLTHDLKAALDYYETRVNLNSIDRFDQLIMILEHEDETFKYLIEVYINRTHEVGEYPIEIVVSGLFKEFTEKPDIDTTEVIKANISSQDVYEDLLREKEILFENFLAKLKDSIQQNIHVDDVQTTIQRKVVMSRRKVYGKEDISFNRKKGHYGLHYGYYGFDDYLYYTYCWMESCETNKLILENTHYESSEGTDIGYIDSVNTVTSHNLLDSFYNNNTSSYSDSIWSSSSSDSGFWSLFSSDSSSSSGGDYSSGSSCSSCSSCSSGSSCSSCSACSSCSSCAS